MYDVIVAGGGPSGSLAAYRCAQSGLAVLILEKTFYPRTKTCGGGLTQKAINEIPFDVSPVIDARPVGGIIAFQGRPLVKVEAPGVAQLIRRQVFDQFLVEKAVSAGVELREGEGVDNIFENDQQVTVQSAQRTYQSRYFIAADGVNSLIARQLGLMHSRKTGMALEAELEVSQSILDFYGPYATFDFGALPFGYGWIFPKNGVLSIGVYRAKANKYPQLRKDYENYISHQPYLKSFGNRSLRAHPIPIGGQKMVRHSKRCLLVGDAANLADPWLGEGLYYAAKSAGIASDVILRCIQKDNFSELRNYSLRINSTLVEQFHYAALIAGLVYKFPGLATQMVANSAVAQKLVFDMISGCVSFKGAFGKIIKYSPVIFSQWVRSSSISQ